LTLSRPVFQNPQSAIRNPQSAIRNPQSAIRNPQSAIRNPQSAIVDVFFKIRNPQPNDPQSAIAYAIFPGERLHYPQLASFRSKRW
jgi:major type 1 subunit fimbrin (pilin)